MDADVIVVGSGPVGLMLASELTLGGARVIVLEKLLERSSQSKALNLQPRTAEVFDLRGLLPGAEEVAIGRVDSGHFAMLPVGLSYAGWETRYPYQVGIPQWRVEEVLEKRLAEQGVQVRRGCDVVELTQDGEGVSVQAGDSRLRARYVVGCDGGRSTVRKQLGVAFPGLDARDIGTVADVMFESTPADVPQVWTTMQGLMKGRPDQSFAGLIPLGEPGLYRLIYGDPGVRIDDQHAPVPHEEIAAVVRDFYGEEAVISKVRAASRFSDASRHVEQYRVGRVFLAGDAAHIHLPAGGQGLNLGVQDAMNLGWKLAAEIAGWAPEGLLDSYHAERHPVGARVIENTRAQSALRQPGPELAALRQVFVRMMALPDANRYLAGLVSGLDIRYDLGEDGEPVGLRLPDFALPTGWASELFHGGRGVLLSTDQRHLDQAEPWSDRVDGVLVPDLLGLGVDAVLVRPDGYICWAGASPVTESLARWFGAA